MPTNSKSGRSKARWEKNRAIRLLVDEAINFKIDCDIYLYKAAAIMGVRYQTLWRYKRKIESAQDPVEKRGPKTAQTIDLFQLQEEIRNLKHGKKRTAGTGELHEIYHGQISRESLNELIHEIRDELKRGRREHAEQIIWDCPHMIWSMDDFEYVFKGIKFYVHQIQDLASRYKFEPLIDTRPIKGEAVAENLRKLFKKHGAPLLMKRDNGSNLNHFSVINALQEFGVIPLNNPAYYPQFNGGMERAQGEVKRELDIQTQQFELPDSFPFAVKQAVHNVNHNPRPASLKGNCSCGVWMLHMGVRFSKRYRSKVYQEIKALAIEMYQYVDYTDKELVISECWRKAVKQWLIVNEHITVIRKREV